MKYLKIRTLFVVVLSLIGAYFTNCKLEEKYACTDEYISICEQSRVYNNTLNLSSSPVFFGREKIEIPSYQFLQNSIVYTCKGEGVVNLLDSIADCCTALTILDDLGSAPTFEWIAPNSTLYAAAVFSNKVELMPDGNSIKNVEEIIWTWNSGMNTGSQSNGKLIVKFDDGRDVRDGKIQTTITSLKSGYAYSWMVWAWNTEGTEIISSSTAIPFRVGLPNKQPISYSSLLGRWHLESAFKLPNGTNVTNSFKLQKVVFYDLTPGNGIKFEVEYIDTSFEFGDLSGDEGMECVLDLNEISFIKELKEGYMLCDERIWLRIDTQDGLFEATLHKF